MKYSYTFATLALAASAVTVYAAPLSDNEALQARSNDGSAPIDHTLAARFLSFSSPHQTENKNQSSTSNGTYGGDDPNTNTNSSSSASQTTNNNGDGNNFGGAAGYGGNGGGGAVGGKSGFNCKKGGKRSLASRRAFARRRGQQQNSGNDSDSDDSDSDSDDDDEGGSHNTSSKSKSDSHNHSSDDHSVQNITDSYNDNSETYNGGSSGSSGAMNVTGSNGGATSNGPCVNFRRGLIAQERRDEASGLALLRSLGAMTERDVEDPLESLAARDVGYSARMLGVEGHAAAGGNARRSPFLFDDGLARRDASGLAVRCAQGYEGCSLAMRREAEEMLREHARDLGFHF